MPVIYKHVAITQHDGSVHILTGVTFIEKFGTRIYVIRPRLCSCCPCYGMHQRDCHVWEHYYNVKDLLVR